jgi:ADP-ribose pyrophosphatase YjhB (NUDIX family)
MWELPGGKVDDEELLAASRREQKEETDLELLGQPDLLGFADCFGRDGQRYLDLFLRWHGWTGQPRVVEPKKQARWEWVPYFEAPEHRLFMTSTRYFVDSIWPKIIGGEQK